MRRIAAVLTAITAILHLYFLVLEMFLWQTPFGLQVFNMTAQEAQETANLAKNQGLYNGFLAAGLIWSFFISNTAFQRSIRFFFLSCIIIAGVYAGILVKFSIIIIQALPALLAILAVKYSTESQK